MTRFRRWLNSNSSIVTVISTVLLIFALGLIVQEAAELHRRSRTTVPDAWFYDLGTGQLFRAKSNVLPPIESPSGPLPNGEAAGVRAKVFACGDCDDPANRFIGWVEKLSPEAKYTRIHEQAGAWDGYDTMGMTYEEGLLVRAVDGDYWYKANSDDGRALIEAPRKKCDPGVVLNSCFPD